VQAHRDCYLGELLGGGAIIVHVALRDHRIGADCRWPKGKLVLIAEVAAPTTAAGADGESRGGCSRSVNHDGDFAEARSDRGGRMRGVGDKGRSADIGRIEKVGREIEVIAKSNDRHRAHTHAGSEQAIDVLDRQAAIVERAADTLGHDLVHGLVGSEASGMFIGADDGAFTA
jgi:hypothetical protein